MRKMRCERKGVLLGREHGNPAAEAAGRDLEGPRSVIRTEKDKHCASSPLRGMFKNGAE